MSVTSVTHKRALGQFRSRLSAEGFKVNVAPGGSTAPYDALVIEMDAPDEDGPSWQIEISYLPFMEEQLEDVSIMQFFAPLSVGIAANVENELNWLITRINTKLPLVGFGFLEEGQVVYFKHNALLVNNDQAGNYKQVQEIINMIGFLVGNFREALQAAANGEKSGREALSGNPFEQLYL